MSAPLPLGLFTGWLATGERGLSSETIVSHLTGQPVGRTERFRWGPQYPHDPADLRRCVQLLDTVPLARTVFPAMRTASPVWAVLVDHWDELESLLREEMAEPGPNAPRTYDRMRELIDSARVTS